MFFPVDDGGVVRLLDAHHLHALLDGDTGVARGAEELRARGARRRQHRACSRPPPPTTRTLIGFAAAATTGRPAAAA